MPADAKLGCARDPLGCYVIRGGSWYSGPATVRSAVRRYLPAQESSESVGFRLVIDNKEDNS
jgi:formylglycine-generating enzyme required for sulfatase activity